VKSSNKVAQAAAETMEGRTLAKGNSRERNAPRTQRRTSTQSALERVRQAAKKDRKQRFTALLHHVFDVERLRLAYRSLKRDAAAGIDGETWRHYGESLEDNLRDLSERLSTSTITRGLVTCVGESASHSTGSHTTAAFG
jgi:phosphoglucomutase